MNVFVAKTQIRSTLVTHLLLSPLKESSQHGVSLWGRYKIDTVWRCYKLSLQTAKKRVSDCEETSLFTFETIKGVLEVRVFTFGSVGAELCSKITMNRFVCRWVPSCRIALQLVCNLQTLFAVFVRISWAQRVGRGLNKSHFTSQRFMKSNYVNWKRLGWHWCDFLTKFERTK